MPKADSTIANLVDHFDASSLRIAEDHLTSGRVRQFLVPVLGTFCGQIMLNERYSHDARIIVDIETSAILSTDCTCHKGSRCSHCAALVLKLLELSGVPFCIRAKRKAARKRVSKGGKKAPELKRQLVYLVPPKPSSASPEITVVTYTYERLRDRLGYLMSQPRRGNRKTFKSVWKSPPVYANDDDIEIAKRWTSVSGRSPYTWRADGEEEKDFDRACDRRTFDALFTQVLETRRCILNMVPEVKLVLGEALPGVFVLDRAGRKQWQVEIKAKRGIKFLPCLRWKHPWYFDSRTGLCGPVVVDADSAEITRLLELRAEGDYQRSRLSSLLVDVNNAMLPEIPSDIQDLQQAPAPQFRTDCPDMRADISPGPRLSEIIISEAADPASADIAPIPFEPGAGSGTGSLIDAYLQATCSDPQIGSQDCTSCGGQQFSTYRTDVLDGQDILDRDEDTGPRLSVPDTKQQEPQTDQLVLELAIKNTVCQKPIFDEGRYVIARIGESVKVLTLSLSDAVSEDGRSGNGHPVTTQELELLRKGSKWITDFGFMRVAPQAVEMHDESVEPPGGRFVFVATASRQWTRLNSDALEKLRAAGLKISNEVEEQLLPSSIECSDICFDVEEKSDWWYSLSLKIEVAGKTVSLLPLLITAIRSLQTSTKISESIEKLNKNGRFEGVLADGTVVSLPFERIRAILLSLQDVLLRGAPGNVLSISALHVAELLKDKNFKKSKWHGAERLISLAGQLNSIKHTRSEAEPPSSFKGELRPYQKEGLAWLKRMAQAGFGGILADDMGLGKTIELLALVCSQKEEGFLKTPYLIVCPTSVLPNWLDEIGKFAPSLTVVPYHGSDRHLLVDRFAGVDVVMTTYAILARDAGLLSKIRWHGIALDEAQSIKNESTQIARGARSLKAGHRFCLTGTPIENNLSELWSQLEFAVPGLLPSHRIFKETIRDPIEKQGNRELKQSLIARVKPFLLRRSKDEVAKDLPEKTKIVKLVDLDGYQRDLYETVRLAMREQVQEEILRRGFKQSRFTILDALLKLRQVCCDSRLLKLSAQVEQAESAKLRVLQEMLSELVAEGRKILVFSQFTSMIALIEEELRKKEIAYVKLTGQTKDRKTPVDEFQSGDAPVFLLSLKAGGTGLNLTAADVVIHYDPWWNPAIEDQATDRAHRIGQTKKVFVYKLIVRGTIEERMIELQGRKRELARDFLDGDGESASIQEEDINRLFMPIGAC